MMEQLLNGLMIARLPWQSRQIVRDVQPVGGEGATEIVLH